MHVVYVHADGDALDVPQVTTEDERRLLRHYESTIMSLCAQLRYPTKVKVRSVGVTMPGIY
jgi:hypothetical protein